MFPLEPDLSEAHRGHQILINHAKNKRKGVEFESPSSKEERMAERKTLFIYNSQGVFWVKKCFGP